MDYLRYEVEDLVRDGYFKKSVLQPDEQSDRFWAKWVSASPLNREKYQQARLVVIALQEAYREEMSDEEMTARLAEVEKSKRETLRTRSRPVGRLIGIRWAAAALVILTAGGIGLWTNYRSAQKEDMTASGDQVKVDSSKPAGYEIIRENNTDSNVSLMLSDSSVVTLLPGSRLKFPPVFGPSDRKVLLTGDAFFEVTANPGAPFLVYAGETVVKVLGTMFRVTAFEQEDRVTVKVLSGKVSVYSFSDFSGNVKAEEMARKGVFLAPNEELVVDKIAKIVERTRLIPRKEELSPQRAVELIFDDTPISDIFLELERMYGVEIEFDHESFRKCPITTYFREESLLERINTICQAVGATYRPENGKIVVSGIDCNGLTNTDI